MHERTLLCACNNSAESHPVWLMSVMKLPYLLVKTEMEASGEVNQGCYFGKVAAVAVSVFQSVGAPAFQGWLNLSGWGPH